MTVYKKTRNQKESCYYYRFIINKQPYYGTCIDCTSKRDAEKFEAQKRKEIEEHLQSKTIPDALAKIICSQMDVTPKKLTEVINEIVTRLKQEKRITLDEAFDRYLQKPSARSASTEHTKRNRLYFDDFVQYIHAAIPNVQYLAEITKDMAYGYVTYLKDNGPFVQKNEQIRVESTHRKNKKAIIVKMPNKHQYLCATTINSRHKAITAVFERLMEDEEMLKINPFKFPKLEVEGVSREVFTYEELEKIKTHYSMPLTKPIFIVGAYSGLTMGDICYLRWNEIHDGFIIRKRRKTKSNLEIPILPELQTLLDEVKAENAESFSEYVFPYLKELYDDEPSKISNAFISFLNGLGIETSIKVGNGNKRNIKGIHSLRHLFAYTASLAGIPQSIVQSILGHLTPEMTELYQRHARREDKQRQFAHYDPMLNANLNINTQPQTEITHEKL